MATQPTGGPLTPYRGEDRRRVAGPVRAPIGRPYAIAGSVIVVTCVLLVLFLEVGPTWIAEAQLLVLLLQAAAFMLAIAVGFIAISRWYLTSDAPALWIGVAILIYGAVRLGVAELLPAVVPAGWLSEMSVWVRPASQIVTIALLVRAATVKPVSEGLSTWRLTGAALLAIAVLAVGFHWLPSLATATDGAQSTYPRSYSAVNQLGFIAVAMTVLGAAFTWHGQRRRRWLFTWLGLMLTTIALGDLVRVVAPPPVESGLLGKEIMRVMGLLAGLNGAAREILYTYRDSSTRLARSEYTAMTAQERIREGQAIAEERAHEARSALAAIEGATKTLERYRDRLPAETQASLAAAVSGEIQRLQRLVSVEHQPGEIGPFNLATALGPIVASERARGVDISVDVPAHLVVMGRTGSTEQVVQTLFDNARRYAPDSPVTVRAAQEHGWIVLRVEDRGPGVPEEERQAIFRRGVRGDRALDVPGSGLGLYVAAQLMQDQAGELWVDARDGGGASFAVALPSAELVASQQTVESGDESGEISHDRGLRVRRGH